MWDIINAPAEESTAEVMQIELIAFYNKTQRTAVQV